MIVFLNKIPKYLLDEENLQYWGSVYTVVFTAVSNKTERKCQMSEKFGLAKRLPNAQKPLITFILGRPLAFGWLSVGRKSGIVFLSALQPWGQMSNENLISIHSCIYKSAKDEAQIIKADF